MNGQSCTPLAGGDRVRIAAGGDNWGYRGVVRQRMEPLHILLTGQFCELYEVTMTQPEQESGQLRTFPLECLTQDSSQNPAMRKTESRRKEHASGMERHVQR